MIQYEVSYRRVDQVDDDEAPWTEMPRISAAAEGVQLTGLVDGATYQIRLRRVNEAGDVTGWSYQRLTLTPPVRELLPPEGIALTDDNCLTWKTPPMELATAGYEIRHAPGDERSWESMEPAHEGLWQSPPLPLCGIPGGERTFAVRTVDTDGNASSPAIIITTPRPLDDQLEHVMMSFEDSGASWPGTIVGGSSAGAVVASPAEPLLWQTSVGHAVDLWDDSPGALLWPPGADLWPRRPGGDAPLWDPAPSAGLWGPYYRAATYVRTFEVPSSVGSGAAGRGRLTLDVEASPAGWRVEYRRQRVLLWPDPSVPGQPLWDTDPDADLWPTSPEPWLPWPGKEDRVGSGLYELRVTLRSGGVAGRLERLGVKVTAPEISERITNLPIPALTAVPLTKTFTEIKDVDIQLVSATGMTGISSHVVDMDPKGPHVVVLDASHLPAPAIANVTVRGW